jgi:hypothetical protein
MYLQKGIGMAASIAGLIVGMQALGAMATTQYSVKVFDKYSARFPIIIGFAKEKLAQVNSLFNACRQLAIAISSVLLSISMKLIKANTIVATNKAMRLKIFSLSFAIIPIMALLGIWIAIHLTNRDNLT